MNGEAVCTGHSDPVDRAARGVPWAESDLGNREECSESSFSAESR